MGSRYARQTADVLERGWFVGEGDRMLSVWEQVAKGLDSQREGLSGFSQLCGECIGSRS